ncbi:MAG: SPFH domain-containing protein [Symploca sp. SIO2G7]|nr:SPFH domain-containing protein [Symploca sp. SIO2G7]
MDIIYIIAPTILGLFGFSVSSTKIITQGNQALVERLGKYQKKLDPGLNLIIPLIDKIAVEETTRGRILDIKPESSVTKDNVSVEVDVVVYWRILDLERAHYKVEDIEEIEDIEDGIRSLVVKALHSIISHYELNAIYASRDQINQTLLEKLARLTDGWGVKVQRIKVQEIKQPESLTEFLEKREAAESEKQTSKV